MRKHMVESALQAFVDVNGAERRLLKKYDQLRFALSQLNALEFSRYIELSEAMNEANTPHRVRN